MESDGNPFPKMELINPLKPIKAVGGFVLDVLLHRHSETPNTGGAPMLDRELYEQQELDYGIYE